MDSQAGFFLAASDTVDFLIGAKIDIRAQDRRAAIEDAAVGFEDVVRQLLEFRLRGENPGAFLPADGVEPSLGQQHRGVDPPSRFQAFLVDDLAGFRIKTVGDSLVADPVEMALEVDGGGNVRARVGFPDRLDLAFAPGADGDGGCAAPADREDGSRV